VYHERVRALVACALLWCGCSAGDGAGSFDAAAPDASLDFAAASDLSARDLGPAAAAGLACGDLQCANNQYCIRFDPEGVPPPDGSVFVAGRWSCAAECATDPRCGCFVLHDTDCAQTGGGGSCEILPSGVVFCQAP